MLDDIQNELIPYREKLATHPLYSKLKSPTDIFVFMSLHIYSVWDFMNLLKTLQRHFTCISIPWVPPKNPKLSRLINEIVLEEESDLIDGQHTSHFMYYFKAIQSLNINAPHLNSFYTDLSCNVSYSTLISRPYIPTSAQTFMSSTFRFIETSTLAATSAFTFGRETLVPTLFEPIKSLHTHSSPELSQFIAYIERHIELDGESHSKLSLELVSELIQSEQDYQLVLNHAKKALESRIVFWDGIANSITNS